MSSDRIIFECRICGAQLDEDEMTEERALMHLLHDHAELVIELAEGLFRAMRE